MIENTTTASFKMETTEQVTTESLVGNLNISQHTVNLIGNAEEQYYQNSLINASLTVISSISLTCCLIFLRIVTKCQKLPTPIKYLSTNFIVSFMMIDFSICLHSIAMFFLGHAYYDLIFDSRIFFASTFAAVLWCSSAALTYERLLALVRPFMYNMYTTKPKLAFLISVIWTVNILVPTIIIIVSASRFCHLGNLFNCDEDVYNLFQPFKTGVLILLIIYWVFIVVAYSKILRIILKHQRNIIATVLEKHSTVTPGNNLKSTKTVAAIISAFIILQSPMVLHLLIFEIQPNLQQHNWRMVLQGMDYTGYQLNMYASLYLYIWNSKECKMQFYLLFSKFSKRFKQAANDMRIEVFDIVVYEKNSANKNQLTDC